MTRFALFILTISFLLPFAAKSQGCDALVKDARVLIGKRQFDEAIKKVEAAKGCAAQGEIDKLYGLIFAGLKRQAKDAKANENIAIEESKKAENSRIEAEQAAIQAEADRVKAVEALESARKSKLAEQRMAYLAEVNEFFRFGESENLRKNYSTALDYYRNALTIFDAIEEKDSVVILKMQLLMSKKQQTERIITTKSLFNRLIYESDSLKKLGPVFYSKAYQCLFDALDMDYDSLTALNGILDLESAFEAYLKVYLKSFKKPVVQGIEYYKLFYLSAKANLDLKNEEKAESRIISILNAEPFNLDTINNDLLPRCLKKRNSHPRRPYEYCSGVGIHGIQNIKDTHFPIFFAINREVGHKSAIGIKFDVGLVRKKKPVPYEFSLLCLNEVFNIHNATWLNTKLSLNLLSGISMGFLSYDRTHTPLTILDMPEIYNVLQEPVQFSDENYEFKYLRKSVSLTSIDIEYYRNNLSQYFNIFTGFRLKFQIDPSDNSILFFTDISYNYQLAPKNEYKNYTLKTTLLNHFESRYTLSSDALSDINIQLDSNGISDMYDLRAHNKNFSSGLRFEFGISWKLISTAKLNLFK